jgi:pimeloyl-ACP methyl ester carboxylesterase
MAGLSHTQVQNIVRLADLRGAWASAPDWADYVTHVADDHAAALEAVGRRLGGLRVAGIGHGWVALDREAVAALQRQPEDADTYLICDAVGTPLKVNVDGHRYDIWLGPAA